MGEAAMSEQRERLCQSLADDLRKAVDAEVNGSDTATERWDLVARRIDLMIDRALFEAARDAT
jgi:hypothetical protein